MITASSTRLEMKLKQTEQEPSKPAEPAKPNDTAKPGDAEEAGQRLRPS